MPSNPVRLYAAVIITLCSLTVSTRGATTADLQTSLPGNFRSFAAEIEKQTGLTLAYSESDIELKTDTFPDITGLDARQAILKVLDEEAYRVVLHGKHVIIVRKPSRDKEEDPAYTASDPVLFPAAGPKQQGYGVGGERESGSSQPTSGSTPHTPDPGSGTTLAAEKPLPASPGGTRLIIIREKTFDGKSVSSTATHSVRMEWADSREPSASEVSDGYRAANATDRKIPFRWDLLESQVYAPPKAAKKRRRRK